MNLSRPDRPQRLALFVSKYDLCLADLLYRHSSGELACDIPLIVSNHPDARRWADFYNIPFHVVPVDPKNKIAYICMTAFAKHTDNYRYPCRTVCYSISTVFRAGEAVQAERAR